ncbi:hypothetical protein EV426DRAFT_572382 [Tirmania nivea]|nr:hypothetical protein EV426DRAFT_572382 [Tirmania nivea]
MDLDITAVTRNMLQMTTSASGLNGRKRKAIGLPATAADAGTRYKRLAPKPDTSNSQVTGGSELIGWDRESEIKKCSPCQPDFTLLDATFTIDASVKPGHIDTSGSAPICRTEDTRFTNHSVSEEEDMLHLNHSAPDAWEFRAPIEFKALDSGPADALGHLPSILSPLVIPSDRQLLEQGWTQNAASPLVICPWRSHLEMIISIDLALANISQKASSATVEPRLKEGLKVVLDHLVELKRSYFKLKKSVQHPKRGTHQDGSLAT